MNDWTENKILNDFNTFKSYCYGTEKLSEGVLMLGSPKEYERHWDYIRKLIKDVCPYLSYDFIDKFDDAICKITNERLRYGLESKEPLPNDFDYNNDNFEKIKKYF